MAHRTGLYELHRTLGATFEDERGWELPGRYQDPVQEHRAVRESAGIVDISYRAVYQVTGSERIRFLNGMVTNDVGKLEDGQGCYACLLNPQGKIVADVEIYAVRDYHLMEVDSRWKEHALDHLNKYIIADDVAFEELGNCILLALQGPGANTVLRHVLSGAALPDGEQRCVELTLNDHVVRVIQTSITGEQGYKLVIPRERGADVWRAVQEAGATPVGMTALNTLRLEAGIPWFGVDFDETHFPQEAGIEDRALSFTKGCYVGQEFVIRIAHRGHVNRRISGLITEREPVPRPGDRVMREDKEVGRITSAARSPTLGKIIGLGMLRREFQESGTAVRIERGSESIPAEVSALPFYRRADG